MPGTITRLVLPDQSVVWLNAGSRLVYPSVFDEKERKVQLFGEGYFEVDKMDALLSLAITGGDFDWI